MESILQFTSKKLLKQFSTLLLLIITLFYFLAANAELIEPSNNLTLEEALGFASEANPDIAVVKRESEAIEGTKTQAAIRPNPSISTSIQDTRSDTRQVFLQLNQEIELGNKREARIQVADAFYDKSVAELESKKIDVYANVVIAFYEVLGAQERLKLSKSSVDIANLALDASAKRVKAGKSSPVEETKSKIAVSAAKIEFNEATSQLNSARKRLSALWGNLTPVFESAQGDVENIPTVSSFADLSATIENSPTIRLAKLEISARENITKLERSKATPNITVSAGVVNNQELDGLNQALLGLTVPIPVFDRNQGNLQEAISRQYKAQDELVALRTQQMVNLTAQYERLNAARLSSESFKSEILPSAQSAFDAASKGFNAGKFSFLDVLDAQRTLFNAKSKYIQVLLDAHQALAEINRITGNTASNLSAQP